MNRLKSLVFVAVVAFGAGEVSHAQVLDAAYGFPFGYSLGAQAAFRNRLPTPPYFSIYPPVYYGKRYVRPYGESPYASFPLLGQVPNYNPVPAETRASIPTTIVNPHAPSWSDKEQPGKENSEPKVMIVTEHRIGAKRTIINPFAREQIAAKE
jgi:hypothetical protein